MNRRGFLTSLLAAAVAPAIIRTPGLLMPIKPKLVQYDLSNIYRITIDLASIKDRHIMLRADAYAGRPIVTMRGVPIRLAEKLTIDEQDGLIFGSPESARLFHGEA